MNLKYELLDEGSDTGLYRIRALRDIPTVGVLAGALGGYVASGANLNQEGDPTCAQCLTPHPCDTRRAAGAKS